MHSRSGSLGAKPPFDLQKSLRFIDGIPQISGEQDTSRGMLTKAVMVDGQTVVFRVGPERDGKAGVYYEMFSKTLITEAVAEKVADRISFFLSLQDDLAPFYAIAARDPKFYPIAKKQVGLHHVKTWSLFEITCWALIAQRTQMPVAKKTRDTLIARFGGSIELEGRTYSAFPDYQTLRTVKVAEILAVTRNRRSAERISSLLSTFEDLGENFLLTAPYFKAEERLKRIKGIGDWSAQFILFRAFGRIEEIQLNMGPAARMIEDVYGPEFDPDEINRTYGEWCGYWSIYLRANGTAPHEDEGASSSSLSLP